MRVVEDVSGEFAGDRGDGIAGVTNIVNDAISSVFGIGVALIGVLLGEVFKLKKWLAGDICRAIHRERTVTMFTKNVGLDILRMDMNFFGNVETETRGIERRAGSEYSVFRKF